MNEKPSFRRLAGLALPLWFFVLSTFSEAATSAPESGLALRQITQFHWYAPALVETGVVDGRSGHTLQGLARFWSQWTWSGVRIRTEVELSGLSRSLSGAAVAGWNTPEADRTFKRFDWTTAYRDRSRFAVSSTIERLDLAWSIGRFDLDLGRQPISLGTSHFVGILDVLAPFHPGYLDASYKPGVDAVRLRTGWSTSGEAEIIAAAARDPSRNALIGRCRQTLSHIDLELLGGRFRDRNFVGLAWEGEKHRITWWGEVGLFQRLPDREGHRGGRKNCAASWIFGMERELRPRLRGGLAYLHQDFGARRARDLTSVAADAPYREGWAFLGASRYVTASLKREISPLVNADLNLIVNLIDGSTLSQPKITFNTGDNSDLSLFGWLGTGAAPGTTAPALLPSEFGAFPDGFGFIVRRFF